MCDQDDAILMALNGALLHLERPTDNHLDNVAHIAQARDLVAQAKRRFEEHMKAKPPGRVAFLDQALNEGDGVYRP